MDNSISRSMNEVLENSLSGIHLSMGKKEPKKPQPAVAEGQKRQIFSRAENDRPASKSEQRQSTLRVSTEDLTQEYEKIKNEMAKKQLAGRRQAELARRRAAQASASKEALNDSDDHEIKFTSSDIFGPLIDDIEAGRVDESEFTLPGANQKRTEPRESSPKPSEHEPSSEKSKFQPGIAKKPKKSFFSSQSFPTLDTQNKNTATDDSEGVPTQQSGSNEYQLLNKIAAGGMAEVWKAKLIGEKGFEKIVAIKKILSHLGDNEEFISMFIDEAKVAANLTHPNIAQIYELGKMGDSFFIAMEYVSGHNLRTICNQLNALNMTMAPEIAVFMGMKLCNALNYAHNKKGYDNRPLHIVHRDVSPQNILISTEGEIKLVDFGIAKASIKATETIAGSLKGKLLYMSPEQADGKSIDLRSDIFSLGAVLFESLTGRKLFVGDSELSILKNVRQAVHPTPRELNPKIPEALEEILLKALAQDPEVRYASAKAMENDLKDFLKREKIHINEGEVAEYVRLIDNKDTTRLTDFGVTKTRIEVGPRPRQKVILPDPEEIQAPYARSTGGQTGAHWGKIALFGGMALVIAVAIWYWVGLSPQSNPSRDTAAVGASNSTGTPPDRGAASVADPLSAENPAMPATTDGQEQPRVTGPDPSVGGTPSEKSGQNPENEEDEELKRLEEEHRKKREELQRLKKKN